MAENQSPPLNLFGQYEPLQPESLTEMTASRIRAMIFNGTLAPGTRLPNEVELASAMGVSRGTLRAALHLLTQQGLIWRRQGLGSYISEKPMLENRLDTFTGVTDLIASMGLKPGCQLLEVSLVQADESTAAQLKLPPESPLVCVRRIRTADDRPVVSSVEFFPQTLLHQGAVAFSLQDLKTAIETHLSLYRVFEQELHIAVDYGIAKIRPIKVDARVVKQIGMDIPNGSVMFYIEQLDFDRNRQPVMLSLEYHVADFCTFTIYRRR